MIIGRTKLEKERKFFVERVVDRGGGRCARAPGTHPAGAGRGARGRTRGRGRYHYYPYLASAGNHGSVSYNLSVINPLSSSKESLLLMFCSFLTKTMMVILLWGSRSEFQQLYYEVYFFSTYFFLILKVRVNSIGMNCIRISRTLKISWMVFIEITETSLMQITKGFEVTSATQTNLMALKVPPPFNVPPAEQRSGDKKSSFAKGPFNYLLQRQA